MLKRVLSYFLFLICCPLVAQVDDAAAVAQRYLETHYNELELTVTDVQNYVLSSQTSSKHNGLTHVYLQQVHANIPVHNAILNLNIKEDGSLLSLGNRFVSDLANKVNTTSPSLGARDAVLRMMNHFNLPNADALGNGTEKEPGQWVFAPEGLALESINVSLRYQSLATGEVRLAWNVDFYQLDAQHWWQARVDTQTGQLIGRNDQVVHCEFDHPHYHEKNGIVEIAMGNEALSFLTTNGDDPAYRVFPLFIESPNHGNRELLVDPADPVASPFGWHDVNAQEGAEYTITRGNNVHAYHDILGINQSSGDEPDGGDSLCFDFPLSFTPPLPYTQLDAATTNLFYWNNLTHDLWYYYGFDEGSGNFQENNYGNGGDGGDYVRAEALDGSGTNNANFATPPDGSRPRMQMYLWGGNLQRPLRVTSPNGQTRQYDFARANFGGELPDDGNLAGELVLATDAVGTTTDGCDPLTNAADLVGKIALVDRGNCQFGTKVLAMEEAGAIAVIVCNNTDDNEEAGLIFAMNPGVDGDQVTIPAVMISLNNCNTIKMDLPGVTVSFENGIPNPGPTGRDSDFDNGVIVHEYTHGISTRLTGGRLQSGCLSSQDQDEQAGEGWSDWFALVMTTTSENFADEPRGIGTYANGQSPAGGGIREYPYTRDMTINEHTYADVTSVSVPHGVGSIFCATLWDMYWNLVDEYGFDDDIFAGTGGNNIAMQLVIDGMKLQPCLPNFIEARDAIIEADEANNNGANYCLIWETFARRGIGASAQDGGVEAFDLPFDCPPAYRVVKTGPEAVTAGENITYNLSIVNGRSETIADAVVTDRIPAGTIYVEGSATCDVSVDGQELTFNLGQATPGAEFDCSYELATDPGLGSRINFEDRVPNGGMWDFANDGSNENNFTLRVNDAYTGILSFIARNYEERSDMFLVLEEPVTLEGTSPGMTFWHQYFTETDVDGGVVEISADGGTTWEDVGADNIPVNGYTTTLASTDNPLAGRPAFSGSSEWIRSMLDLSAYAGQTVLVRFRFGSNSGGARLGWIIDDITVFDDLNYLENTACTDNDGEELCSTVITVVNTDLNSNTLEINQTRSLELYPNPVQETLTVSLAETITETVEVALLGTDGKVLQSQQFSQFQQTELDLSNLPAGIYLLRFQTETDVTTRRVVKQ